MIFYSDKKAKEQIKSDYIESDYKELESYRNLYSKRISLYNTFLDTMQIFDDGVAEKYKINKEDIENRRQVFQIQINKIDSNLEILTNFLKNIDLFGNVRVEKKTLKKYNQNYKEIKDNYIINSASEAQIIEKYINGLMSDLAKTLEKMKEEYVKGMEKILIEKSNTQNVIEKKENDIQEEQMINHIEEKEDHIKNNNTLLISEKQQKVILPYTAEEVLKIFNKESNKYNSVEDVIEDKFTRDFSDFKIQFASRYTETMKLAREREKYSFIDSVTIATEMMKKRYLHPAIISACRTLTELDVYLDCLDKNELEDFKIFNIKYELYPMTIKSYNNGKRAKHKENSNFRILSKLKGISKKKNREII